jgi:HAMP domain-containing protein
MVLGKLPLWIVGLVVAAGVALGALLFLLRWLAKRRDPAYSPGRSFGAFALGGALAMVGLASLPAFYLAFWVQSGPSAVPLATLSNRQKMVVFQGMQHIGVGARLCSSVVRECRDSLKTEGDRPHLRT